MTDEEKQTIDSMSYEQMLRKWRHEPLINGYFNGERGLYFSKRMRELNAEVGEEEHTRLSNLIGWGE